MALSDILDSPLLYRLWQAPFAGQKLRPFLRHNSRDSFGRVLDVGCGPGTNAKLFRGCDYTGIDLSPRYIDLARRRYPGKFLVADATTFDAAGEGVFDTILVNSLLHHLDDESAAKLLGNLGEALSPNGHVHVIDMYVPDETSAARWLALHDRGEHPRSLPASQALLEAAYEPAHFETFSLALAGATMWRMLYLKGRPRHA